MTQRGRTWEADSRREEVRRFRLKGLVPLAIAAKMSLSVSTVARYLNELAGQVPPVPSYLDLGTDWPDGPRPETIRSVSREERLVLVRELRLLGLVPLAIADRLDLEPETIRGYLLELQREGLIDRVPSYLEYAPGR